MAALTDEARSVITGGNLGHLVTLNPDGSPQASVVWIGLDGDAIVTAHLAAYQKIRNIRRDPRVVLTIETGVLNAAGMTEYLIVHGKATVNEGGAPALLNRLAKVYLGPDATYPPMPNPPEGYVLSISVDRVGGIGPWTGGGH
ncbi:PPOX class F420-dependent oxidoreductase [Pseudofrankia sp. DC12]|uniref:PPOX class F420-dependent oxidoreductase n=1 Tax=Pseudofrankia sp. DC12 TaxID=683315 RepID=UPI0005F78AAB|nr:PPOX class F420-dependent oxidoreductase [Pseudofrankia sp. DC12]